VIEFSGRTPWGKLMPAEQRQINWHRTAVRGLPSLAECRTCDGDGRVACDDCKCTGEEPCLSTCRRDLDEKGYRCWVCKGTGKRKCSSCKGKAKAPRCPDCHGDGAVPVALREAC